MPYTHKWNDDGVYIKYFDTLTTFDLVESNSLLVGKREFEVIKYIITDFSDITNVEVDDNDAALSTSFAEKVNPYNKHIKVALVSNNTYLQPLIKKYIEDTKNIIPHAEQELFSNITEAKIWINS